MSCKKPNCDCIERAEKENGGNPVMSYPCLYPDRNLQEENTLRITTLPVSEVKSGEEDRAAAFLDWFCLDADDEVSNLLKELPANSNSQEVYKYWMGKYASQFASHQVEPSQPVKGLSEGVLGEIITGEECVRRGYSNDSMGQTINEDAAYADMLVRSKLLHQLTEIDNDGSYNMPDSLNYFAPANVGVSVDWDAIEGEADKYADEQNPNIQDRADLNGWWRDKMDFLKSHLNEAGDGWSITAKKALEEIKNWDDDMENKYGDPGSRAQEALEQYKP